MKAPAGCLRLTMVSLAAAWLASCATTPPAPVEEAISADARARQAEMQGDDARAAALWQEAADSATGPMMDAYRVNAADAWLRAGNQRRAFETTDLIDEKQLKPSDRQRYLLLRAHQALAGGDIDTAARTLADAGDWMSPELAAHAEKLEKRIGQLQSGAGVDLLQRLSADLGASTRFNLTQAAELLARYEYAPSSSLREAASLGDVDLRAASWADLIVRIRRSAMRDDRLVAAAESWQQTHPGHAVGYQEFLELSFVYSQRFSTPPSVAVLLPMKGGLAAVGAAIRDGLLSAYLERPEAGALTFYESGDTPAEALLAYRKALADGADWVIGPVRQDSVAAIAGLGLQEAPTLALNDLPQPFESTPPADFHTLSLSQEAETATIARKMREAGIERVITLTADSAWGNRMEVAFVEAFVADGGKITDLARFPVAANDHSAELTRVLQIDQSRDRKERLQSLLGEPLSFEPRLRNDFDAFFMSSLPDQARQIRPQLRFYEAGETPLFAVSRVYSGIPDPSADRDLNGVVLPLSSLQLESASSRLPAIESIRGGSMLSLYALGADAWNLLKWLPLLQIDPDLAFPGSSGELTLGPNGRLLRQPAWAIFDGGRPVPYDPATILKE